MTTLPECVFGPNQNGFSLRMKKLDRDAPPYDDFEIEIKGRYFGFKANTEDPAREVAKFAYMFLPLLKSLKGKACFQTTCFEMEVSVLTWGHICLSGRVSRFNTDGQGASTSLTFEEHFDPIELEPSIHSLNALYD